MSTGPGRIVAAWRARRGAATVAVVLAVLGVIGVAVRLDAAGDGTILTLDRSTFRPDGVVVSVPDPDGTVLRTGDLVTAIGGRPLDGGRGGPAPPEPGSAIAYELRRDGSPQVASVRVDRPAIWPLVKEAWGDLVFVIALAALAVALSVRRPDEPSTGPLLVLGAGLAGSTAVVVAGLPALALATGGPVFWLFQLNTVGSYSIAWGGLLAFSLRVVRGHPWAGRWTLRIAPVGPLAVMLAWTAIAGVIAPGRIGWLALVHTGQTAVVALSLLFSVVLSVVGYRAVADPLMRSRVRWLAAGGAAGTLLGILGWHLPQLLTGAPLLPWGALGLSGLPFVAGIGVALRRHRLFDIERLANRSLVYAATVALLVAGYAIVVAVLVSGLNLSDTVAAALAAAAAALTLAPVRSAAQRAVDRLMYGDRHDPAGALDRLGARLGSAMLPADVLPAVVQTVARSLRVTYAAIDLADDAGRFQPAAEEGTPATPVHVEPLYYQGRTVGRLRVSARGRDDPLDEVDLALVGSLARQAGPAVQAVRLHDDLLRSRADVVASREDERRRLRRDLHDGLGPTLAAIGLKARLAAREVPTGSAAQALLAEIATEAAASVADVRRLVEALRPPALDELGLVGAVRSRADALGGAVAIEVCGDVMGSATGRRDHGDDGTDSADGPPVPLPAAVETAAYRIAVEAMTNVVRHSGATACTVRIQRHPDALEVTVADNGRGLDPERPSGVGLRSMRERADELGGEWSLGVAEEGGTLVRAHLPLAPRGRAG